MFRLIPPISRGPRCLLRPLIQRPPMVRSIVARPSRATLSMLRRQIRRYSSESGHSGSQPTTKADVLWPIVSFSCTWVLMTYYLSLPANNWKRQLTELVSMETTQTSVPDEYEQPATPQHTRQEVERQKRLNGYRGYLFGDIRDRCENFCTQSPVPCPLIEEVHAIYVREVRADTKSLIDSPSRQNETRTTREELQRLARLDEERGSMFYGLRRRCEDLCLDSPRPCSIWQEVYKIHEREMDAQEREGGESSRLRWALERC